MWNESNSPFETRYARDTRGREAWSKLSNYVRLYALYNYGGIYLDTDVELLKPLEPLLKHKCFLGFQLNEGGRDHEEMQQVKNVTIYPIECFYPFNWEESFHADHITSATYTIHYSEGSWLKQSAPEA